MKILEELTKGSRAVLLGAGITLATLAGCATTTDSKEEDKTAEVTKDPSETIIKKHSETYNLIAGKCAESRSISGENAGYAAKQWEEIDRLQSIGGSRYKSNAVLNDIRANLVKIMDLYLAKVNDEDYRINTAIAVREDTEQGGTKSKIAGFYSDRELPSRLTPAQVQNVFELTGTDQDLNYRILSTRRGSEWKAFQRDLTWEDFEDGFTLVEPDLLDEFVEEAGYFGYSNAQVSPARVRQLTDKETFNKELTRWGLCSYSKGKVDLTDAEIESFSYRAQAN